FELLSKLFISFYPKLEKLLQVNSSFLELEFENTKSNVFAKALNKKSDKFTLGTMVFILNIVGDINSKSLKASNLFQEFRNHILTRVHEKFLKKDTMDNINSLTSEYRNKAAHVEEINLQKSNDFKIQAAKVLVTFTNSLK